jgi:hypothetical protein
MGHDASRSQKDTLMNDVGITLCAIFRIPPAGQREFQAYETAVLPFLNDHSGVLQRRLRADGPGVEIHVIWFPSAANLDAYRADPRRSAHAGLFDASGAVVEALFVEDVPLSGPD